jgi:hypothetical protein
MGITASFLRIDVHVAEMWLKWAMEWSGRTRGVRGLTSRLIRVNK